MQLRDLADAAVNELRQAMTDALLDQMDDFAEVVTSKNRIALYGVGREGLVIKALAMRLRHLGLDCHVVGDMTTPPIGKGDLLIVSAGPGYISTVAGLVDVARNGGATTVCVTARPQGAVPQSCDRIVVLKVQTMANDLGQDAVSVLPMGSLFELVMFVFFELLVHRIRETLGMSLSDMRGNHTNLE